MVTPVIIEGASYSYSGTIYVYVWLIICSATALLYHDAYTTILSQRENRVPMAVDARFSATDLHCKNLSKN